MKITIFGSGYVGLVTGVCLAEVGHNVLCVDIDETKIRQLESGISPIYEPGLETLLKQNLSSKRIAFTTSAEKGVLFGKILMIAVGTPPDEDGSADLQYVMKVAENIGRFMPEHRYIVYKSTVPVGTGEMVRNSVETALKKRNMPIDFDIISNPEFLKEGAALSDFMRPDRIIVGTENSRDCPVMRDLYAPFNRNRDRLMVMDIRSAELTKYAANAMLATKISFMNELANIAERVGADIENVRHGIGSDSRIGYHFIYPGCSYGGSCFPKDVRALAKTANDYGYIPQLLESVEKVNTSQKEHLFQILCNHFGGVENLSGKTFAVWGLAFKPETDDMRDAPSRTVLEKLWLAGARVQAFDPVAMNEAKRLYGHVSQDYFQLMKNKELALNNADALLIFTEWKNFKIPDFEALKSLKNPVIFDGRNLYEPVTMEKYGFTYYAIGRGQTYRLFTKEMERN